MCGLFVFGGHLVFLLGVLFDFVWRGLWVCVLFCLGMGYGFVFGLLDMPEFAWGCLVVFKVCLFFLWVVVCVFWLLDMPKFAWGCLVVFKVFQFFLQI